MIRQFTTFSELREFVEETRSYREAVEGWFSGQKTFQGFCDRCWAVRAMTVNVGVLFGDRPSLREGLRCECGLSGRQRLLYAAVKNSVRDDRIETVCILERQSALFTYLDDVVPKLQGSEFFGPGVEPGSVQVSRGERVVNQDFCNLSYVTDSVDLLVHNDILEHIPDFTAALREARRVLRPGGTMIFTCPFFAMKKTIVRARHDESGQLVHLLKPEIHGDGLRPDGILAYYNYGWELIEEIGTAGFSTASVKVDYDPFRGLTSCNFPENETDELSRSANMLPLWIEATV